MTSIRVPSELIWVPDIVLYNKYEQHTPNVTVNMKNNVSLRVTLFFLLLEVVTSHNSIKTKMNLEMISTFFFC